ncbi:(Fe-S)-binding protein [Pyrobaculum neutrophilum]|uniref:4Fe-4S ferredoxin iron-sulfur binding domain protein n=1 Tax=Pyrobaculum neutrophilum (strain DSM 2338 / JCM 9278 / NBRC 100436 / V24Sta) TaxID=444157 RepID=B1YE02_PYRNV|nr:(Fe-S)-binding protein [Pyrobaculum neutrophilum]ACB40015.1 4Fe-4S ferredoxin iron-sulfur binding domain protein [Pyrobaculum neutrophilum V24Sta]
MELPPYVSSAVSACMRCGNCVDVCPSYVATGDLRNSPMGRLQLLKGASWDELTRSFHLCTMCKRCAYFCPTGIDVAEVTRQIRDVLSKSGRPPPYVSKVVENMLRRGNNVGLTPGAVAAAVRAAAKAIEKERGEAPRVFLYDGAAYRDPSGAEAAPGRAAALLFPSSSDVFEFDVALRGYIYLLNKLGFDVVVSLRLAEVANYGYYLSTEAMYKIAGMYLEEIGRVRPQVVVLGECGHGWHVFSRIVAPRSPRPALHILQLLYRAHERGRLRLKPVEVPRPVVYMDPCNYSRGAAPLVREPRALLKAAVGEYVELWKNPGESVCCLGGGGLIAPDALDLAVHYWRRAYGGVEFGTAVRPCATCKAQLRRVFAALGIKAEVTGVVELVYKSAV